MKKILFIALTTIALTACSKEANKQTETKPTTEDKSVTAQTGAEQTPSRVSYLEISPKTQKCDAGAGQMDCLQVKQLDYKDGQKTYKSKDWENFYAGIEGFTHKSNEQVLIRVKEYDIPNPPADGSSVRYVLDEVIEKVPSK